MLQSIIVILLFLVAAIWLGKKAWKSIKGNTGCDHCAIHQVHEMKKG